MTSYATNYHSSKLDAEYYAKKASQIVKEYNYIIMTLNIGKRSSDKH